MRSKFVTKNNVTFTVISNDGQDYEDDEVYYKDRYPDYYYTDTLDEDMLDGCSYRVGEKIIEFVTGNHKDRVYFGGFNDDGRALFATNCDIICGPPGMDINRQTVAELYADHYKVDIYKLTNSNKSTLFEAATDMSEKKSLYDILGIEIEIAYKYDRKKIKKCP